MKIIDVSEHNGDIDYAKVEADGVDGVIIRAGYGKGNVDGKFTANITGAIKQKMNIGIYWFSYAYTEEMARREARYCNDIIEPYRIELTLPVFFDWEYDSMRYAKKNGVNPDKALITKMIVAFCDEISKLRYTAGYYTNLDYSENYIDESQLKTYKRWYARYIKTPQKDCYLWQNSDKGSVDGVSGNVDINTLWGEISVSNPEPINPTPETTKAAETPQNASEGYIIGNVYTVDVVSALNVRRGAGSEFGLVGYSGLTPDGKAHATRGGALLPKTRVTCLELCEKPEANQVWMRIPSGWICAVDNGKHYVI